MDCCSRHVALETPTAVLWIAVKELNLSDHESDIYKDKVS